MENGIETQTQKQAKQTSRVVLVCVFFVAGVFNSLSVNVRVLLLVQPQRMIGRMRMSGDELCDAVLSSEKGRKLFLLCVVGCSMNCAFWRFQRAKK